MDLKIGSVPTAGISRYSEVQKKAPQSVQVKQESDKVDTSSSSRLFNQALRAVKESPDVRADKVEAIRKSIEDGTYRVDSEAIADKMLSSIR